MADDLSKTGKGDDIRININQAHEVSYWSRELNTTAEKLRRAVEAVGPMVANVKRWLNSNK